MGKEQREEREGRNAVNYNLKQEKKKEWKQELLVTAQRYVANETITAWLQTTLCLPNTKQNDLGPSHRKWVSIQQEKN